ncbi:chemotaxis protein histidine kinase CheA [Parvibaculum sp. MBR-TMA-1.3b-4.2]|jgi:chemotaxis protein histidine kinase CheA
MPLFIQMLENGTMASFDENDSSEYARLIAKAEAAVEALRDSYKDQFRQDVDQMFLLWAKLEDGADRRQVMDEIYAIAHNVKGQGGSFGYDFVTALGASLCRFLRATSAYSDDDLKIVRAHLDALLLAASDDMSGDGGAKGRDILRNLSLMTGYPVDSGAIDG